MCPETTQEELRIAGDTAHEAFLSWRNTSVLNRQQVMFKLQQKLKDNMVNFCLLYTSPSPRDKRQSRMPSSA